MLSPNNTLAKRFAGRTLIAAATLLLAASLVIAPSASAGTYPMYQCAPGVPAVSPGWSVFANNTNATTLISNGCSAGGSIGDSVSTDEQAGAVTENGKSGSQVGLQIDVPNSASGVTIHAVKAEVIGSAVTGDDAFLGFASAGQALPGGAELPYGGNSAYTATENWTLPQGARDFEAYVNCSTDRSSPTCDFADSNAVPALTNITLSLEDDKFAFAFRRRVGLVFQNPDVQLFNPTVFDEVAFGPLQMRWPKEEIRQRVGATLDALEITHLKHRPPHRLSGGEKKRVAIASVLAGWIVSRSS